MNNDANIAIIGMDGRFPGANTLNEFWHNLVNGQSTITEIPEKRWQWQNGFSEKKGSRDKIYSRWGGFIDGVDEFDPLFFNISPAEAKSLDPQERLFLETSWNVFEDAGYSMERIRNELSSTGVFVGAMYSDYGLRGGGNHHWSIANRVSFFFDLNGPSMAVDSACSSSLLALHLACESIRRGECRQAIAGGVSLILHKKHYQDLCKMQMLSASPRCAAFGHDADGFVDGEGVGAVLLKPYQQALADGDRIYAVIAGSAVNSGGRTNGYTVPNPAQQSNAIAGSLKAAGISPDDVSYIEAHGTGTSLGDPIEISALLTAFEPGSGPEGRSRCAIGSVKPNIGHLEAAAGIAGLIKILLQLKHQQIVPTLNCEKENPRIDLAGTPFYLNKELQPWSTNPAGHLAKRRCAGISSFGAGGTNVHLILTEHSEPLLNSRGAIDEGSRPYLITISGKRPNDLRNNLNALYDFLLEENHTGIDELAYSLHVAKTDFEHRMIFISSSISELTSEIREVLDTESSTNSFRSDNNQDRNSRLQRLVEQKGGEEYLYSLWLNKTGNNDSLLMLGKLWLAGVDINWHSLYVQQQASQIRDSRKGAIPGTISLPRYVFDKNRYWLDDTAEGTDLSVKEGIAAQPVIKASKFESDEHSRKKQDVVQAGSRSSCIELFDGTVSLIDVGENKACFDVISDIAQNNPSHLVVMGCLPKAELKQELERLEALGANTIYLESRDNRNYSKAINYIMQRFGRLDIVALCSEDSADPDGKTAGDVIEAGLSLDRATANIPLSHFLHIIVCDNQNPHTGTLVEEFCLQRNKMVALQKRAGEALMFHCQAAPSEKQPDAPILPTKERVTDVEADLKQIEDTLVSILSSVLEISAGELTAKYRGMSFFDIGIDSIFSARICEQISEHTVEKISPVLLYNYNNLPALANYLKGKWKVNAPEVHGEMPALQDVEISAVPADKAVSADKPDSETVFFQPCWRNYSVNPGRKPIDGNIVLVGATRKFAEQFRTCGNFIQAGNNAIIDHSQWSDSIFAAADLSEKSSKPIHLVYFSNEDIDVQEDGLEQIKNIFSTFRSVLNEAYSHRKIAITYIATEPFAISGPETNSPLHEAVASLGRSLVKEFRHLRFDFIEFSITSGGESRDNLALIDLICANYQASLQEGGNSSEEIWNQSAHYRLLESKTEIKCWQKLSSLDENLLGSGTDLPRGESLAGNASYFISGGSSGIGLLFATYLASSSAGSNVYICSRSEPGAESRQQIAKINANQLATGTGSKIIHIRADVTCSVDMKRVFEQIERDGKPLKGIIHNAGISRDAMLRRKSWQDISSILAVKILGVHWLDKYSAGLDLDFFVMSSSLSSVVGNAGQTDYAFANGYLDGFSRKRQSLVRKGARRGRTISINWPLWCNRDLINGMEVPAHHLELLEEKFGLRPLATRYGLQALQRILELDGTQTMVLHGMSAQINKAVIEPLNGDYPPSQPSDEELSVANSGSENEPIPSSGNSGNPDSMDIAIVGVAGRFPDADSPDELFENCLNRHIAVRELPEPRFCLEEIYDDKPFQLGKTVSKYGGLLKDIDQFDAKFFGVMPMEANYIDPQQRLFLQSAWHAFEDAGYTKAELHEKNCGVYVGCMTSDYQKIIEQQSPPNAFAMLGTHAAVLPARLSYWLNLKGPAVAVDTACSSSLVALHQACNSLRLREIEMALVSSVYLLANERDLTTASQAGMLSATDGCKTFDQSADGIAIGEAVTALVLKPLDAAERDGDQIYAVIKGSGTNQDGHTSGMTAPNSLSQISLLNDVYRRFNINPDSIDYIETHGTGTKLGDPIECEALATVFGTEADSRQQSRPCYLGALKPNVGHAFNAAGMSSLIKVLMAIKYQTIPPVTRVSKVNELINLEHSRLAIPPEPVKWSEPTGKPMRAGVTALGYSGTNAHVILDTYQRSELPLKIAELTPRYQCFVISETTPERLAAVIEQLVVFESRWKEHDIYPEVQDLAFSSQRGREHHEYRAVIIACSKQSFSNALHRLKAFSPQQLADGISESADYAENSVAKRLEQWGVVSGRALNAGAISQNNISSEKEHLFYDKMTLSKLWCMDEIQETDMLSTSDACEQNKAVKVSLPLKQYDTQSYWIAVPNTSKEPKSAEKLTSYNKKRNVKETKQLIPLAPGKLKRPNANERAKLSGFIKQLEQINT